MGLMETVRVRGRSAMTFRGFVNWPRKCSNSTATHRGFRPTLSGSSLPPTLSRHSSLSAMGRSWATCASVRRRQRRCSISPSVRWEYRRSSWQ
jgi:hypothetical protein